MKLSPFRFAATVAAKVPTGTRREVSRHLSTRWTMLAAVAAGIACAPLAQAALPAPVMQRALQALRCDAPHARVLLVADFAERNTAPRFAAFDLTDPWQPRQVLETQVAHGLGSDPDRTGWATRFSNVPDSEMTSLGAYHVAESYTSHGTLRYRLDGESASNYLARPRDILLHVGDYVSPQSVAWSQGCFAISAAAMQALRDRFGSLTGAFLWADGPGVQVPPCAANTAPWQSLAFSSRSCSSSSSSRLGGPFHE